MGEREECGWIGWEMQLSFITVNMQCFSYLISFLYQAPLSNCFSLFFPLFTLKGKEGPMKKCGVGDSRRDKWSLRQRHIIVTCTTTRGAQDKSNMSACEAALSSYSLPLGQDDPFPSVQVSTVSFSLQGVEQNTTHCPFLFFLLF